MIGLIMEVMWCLGHKEAREEEYMGDISIKEQEIDTTEVNRETFSKKLGLYFWSYRARVKQR